MNLYKIAPKNSPDHDFIVAEHSSKDAWFKYFQGCAVKPLRKDYTVSLVSKMNPDKLSQNMVDALNRGA